MRGTRGNDRETSFNRGWGEREATKRIITSAFVLILVTVPFFLAGLPILYPEW
ncbi:MAG: hypothetical protein ACE5OZ_17070 [Candidatus Heimdallarchaeota archaeon]